MRKKCRRRSRSEKRENKKLWEKAKIDKEKRIRGMREREGRGK